MLPINHRKVVKRALFAINNCTTLIPTHIPAEAVDSADGGAYAAIALADVIAEER